MGAVCVGLEVANNFLGICKCLAYNIHIIYSVKLQVHGA